DNWTLETLRGASLSLVDPASTSGSIVPRAAMQHLTGHALENWFGRVSFAGSHDLAIDAVLNDRVTAAFVSETYIHKTASGESPAADALQIVWRSNPIPSDPFAYQTDLCQTTKDAIERVFFAQKEQLAPFFKLRQQQGFVRVSDEDYQFMIRGTVDSGSSQKP